MTTEEKMMLECFRTMKKTYPNENLVLCATSSYEGYNLATHKKIKLVEVELEDD